MTKVKNFLKTWYDTIISGRTAKAEYEVARMLHHTEYRNESFDTVLYKVRNKRLFDA